MEKVVGEQGLAFQQHFPYKPLKFPKIETVVYTYSFMPGASNVVIFDALFPFLACFKLFLI